MIVIYNNYEFSQKDVGKKVLLANSNTATIISVIKEYGGVCIICGKQNDEFYIWNHAGKAELDHLNILAIFGEKDLIC